MKHVCIMPVSLLMVYHPPSHPQQDSKTSAYRVSGHQGL